jgi:hypothetical protein
MGFRTKCLIRARNVVCLRLIFYIYYFQPLLAFAAHKTPHLIHLGCLHLVDDDLHLLRINGLEKTFMDMLYGRLFF